MNHVKDMIVDLSEWWKDYTSVANLDVVNMAQANLTDLCRIPGKPRSILSLLPSLFIKAQEYNFIWCIMW